MRAWNRYAFLAVMLAGCAQTGPGETSGHGSTAATKAPALDPGQGDGGVSAFYVADRIPSKPGVMIRTEALTAQQSLDSAGSNVRILYSSTDGLDGKTPVAVSGALYLPKGEAPAGGWPLIAWAHGTVGVADICAPSWNARSDRDRRYLNHWLEQGYAVVASDYQGLGAPGGHPYLTIRPVAYSVLDSVRAVQAGDYPVSRKLVIVGQSQGGGAGFGTAGYAQDYAPEIDLRGTVATGTPYFTPTSPPAVRDPNEVSPVLAYTFLALYLKAQVDPAFRPEAYLTPAAVPVYRMGATSCFGPMARTVVESKLTQAASFTEDPLTLLSAQYRLMSYKTLKLKGPVFMGIGGQDKDVPPEGQLRLVKDACAAGSVIEHHVYSDLDHSGTVNGSLADSTPFVKKAFAGEAIAGNCGR
jgi:hypothetical protein